MKQSSFRRARAIKRFFTERRTEIAERASAAREISRWENAGRPAPPPHSVKIRTIRAFRKRFATTTFIETGTFMGDMVSAVKNEFRSIFSIELDDVLFDAAKRNFEGLEHVRILHGDSATVLPYVLAQVHGPCLFWLDAHYSGGITARSSVDTPILDELSQIFACHHIEPVILIDDARLFAGPAVHPILDDSWLMLSDLKRFILDVRPDWTVEVQDDIIRVHRSQV